MYQYISNTISSAYPLTGKSAVDYNVLFPLYFGDTITLTGNAMLMITKSILTNAVQSVDRTGKFLPQASVVMLAHIGKRILTKNPSSLFIVSWNFSTVL